MSERLTWRNEQGVATFKRPVLCERCDEPTWSICDESGENITERMCDLEDLLCDESGEEAISLEKLREIAEAEREGRVAVLPPVKRGDRVWILRRLRGGHVKPVSGLVGDITLTYDGRVMVVVHGIGRGEWGERVFQTRPEAEAALAKKEGV